MSLPLSASAATAAAALVPRSEVQDDAPAADVIGIGRLEAYISALAAYRAGKAPELRRLPGGVLESPQLLERLLRGVEATTAPAVEVYDCQLGSESCRSVLVRILRAVTSNTGIRKVVFANCGLGDAAGLSIAEFVTGSPRLQALNVRHNQFGSVALEAIATAAADAPCLAKLALVGDRPIELTEPLVAAYARWWRRSPGREVKGAEDVRLAASAASRTARGEGLQAAIARVEESGVLANPDAADRTLQDLRRQIGLERDRLAASLSTMELGSNLLGGLQFVQTIRSSNDNPGQALPEFILAQTSEQQLDYLMFLAARYEPRFRGICDEVVSAINNVVCVDKLLSQYGLEGLSEEHPSVVIQDLGAKVDGTYRAAGALQGRPFYKKDAEPACVMHVAETNRWVIRPSLFATTTLAELPVVGPPCQAGWHCPQKAPAPKQGQSVDMAGSMQSLREELAAGAFSPQTPRQFAGLVPPSGELARVHYSKRKEPAAYLRQVADLPRTGGTTSAPGGVLALYDINQATLETAYPAVLRLMHELVVSIVERQGGSIVEVRNDFAPPASDDPADLLPQSPLQSPPCVRLRLALSGFVMELHLTLSDYFEAQRGLTRLHTLECLPTAAEVIEYATGGSRELKREAESEEPARSGCTHASARTASSSSSRPRCASEHLMGTTAALADVRPDASEEAASGGRRRASEDPATPQGVAFPRERTEGRLTARREVALLKSARRRLVRLLFRELDHERSGRLSQKGLLRFFTQLSSGFVEDDWPAFCASLVARYGDESDGGLDPEQFLDMVNDHSGPGHCTTGELCSLLAGIEGECAGEASEPSTPPARPRTPPTPQATSECSALRSDGALQESAECAPASPLSAEEGPSPCHAAAADGTHCAACRRSATPTRRAASACEFAFSTSVGSACASSRGTSPTGSGWEGGRGGGSDLGQGALRRVVAALREVATTTESSRDLEGAIKVARAAGADEADLRDAKSWAAVLAERRSTVEELHRIAASVSRGPVAAECFVGKSAAPLPTAAAQTWSGLLRELETIIDRAEKAEVPESDLSRARTILVEQRRRAEAEERLKAVRLERDATKLAAAIAEARSAGFSGHALVEFEALLLHLSYEERAKRFMIDTTMTFADDTDGSVGVASNCCLQGGSAGHPDAEPGPVQAAGGVIQGYADMLAKQEAAREDAKKSARAVVRAAVRGRRASSLRSAIALGEQAGLEDRELSEARALLVKDEERERLVIRVGQLVDEYADIDMQDIAGMRVAKERLSGALEGAVDAGAVFADLVEGEMLRKRLHNKIEDLKGAIRVFCRIRPLSQAERDVGEQEVVTQINPMTLKVGKQTFQYDAVFSPGSQEDIFEDCKELVQSAFDGYNVTLFAYGQTGAGKTFTMSGAPGEEGIAPRTVSEVWRLIRKGSQRFDYTVSCSMLELYKNDLVDLLAKSGGSGTSPGRRLSVRHSTPASAMTSTSSGRSTGGLGGGERRSSIVTVDHLSELECESEASLMELLERGTQARAVAATAMNSKSSRSHLMLVVRVVGLNRETGEEVVGKIIITDLAGSERLKKTDPDAETQRESIEINKSLTALGDVIEALTKRQKMVPYRNHKLTQLMQDALGGTAKTLMFVNCAPSASNLEETLTSLKYAARAKGVINHAAASHTALSTDATANGGWASQTQYSARRLVTAC